MLQQINRAFARRPQRLFTATAARQTSVARTAATINNRRDPPTFTSPAAGHSFADIQAIGNDVIPVAKRLRPKRPAGRLACSAPARR
jgi:hypothetical protein